MSVLHACTKSMYYNTVSVSTMFWYCYIFIFYLHVKLTWARFSPALSTLAISADMSTPALSTPLFLTVPLCPLPQIPSTLFSKSKNATFYVFWSVMSKNVKNAESIIQVFTFVHFEIANWHFRCTRKRCYRKDDRAMRAIYVDREPLRRYGHSKLSKMAAAAILDNCLS